MGELHWQGGRAQPQTASQTGTGHPALQARSSLTPWVSPSGLHGPRRPGRFPPRDSVGQVGSQWPQSSPLFAHSDMGAHALAEVPRASPRGSQPLGAGPAGAVPWTRPPGHRHRGWTAGHTGTWEWTGALPHQPAGGRVPGARSTPGSLLPVWEGWRLVPWPSLPVQLSARVHRSSAPLRTPAIWCWLWTSQRGPGAAPASP